MAYSTRHSSQPLVSIITPTRNRESRHPFIHNCVKHQDWPAIEWLVDDDSDHPSSVLSSARGRRLVYQFSSVRRTIGDKRNNLVAKAQGDYIVHFDDDDYYSPNYVSTMIDYMNAASADLCKLSGTFIYDQGLEKLFYWDQTKAEHLFYNCDPGAPLSYTISPIATRSVGRRHRLGYGYSYVYRRRVWDQFKFPSLDFAEDLDFMVRASAEHRAEFLQDSRGLCLHVIHEQNQSGARPQYLLPDVLLDVIFPGVRNTLSGGRQP